MRRIVFIFALLCIVKITTAQQIISSQKIKLIDSLLTYLEQEQRFMGAVCIRDNNKTILNKGYGIISNQNGKIIPANADTRYRIGSISKTYTAVMILQLQEENKLSLDDKLVKYFKQIPNADSITIKQMLLHQTGLYNYTDDEAWHNTQTPVSEQQMLATFAAQKPIAAPGGQTSYCNTNYMLLGYIIEQVTGKSYNENLQKRIVEKIKLTHTLMPEGNANAARNEAVSFTLDDNNNWIAIPEIHVTAAAGAGGIIATAEDVNKFYEALLQGKLLKKTSLNEMMPIRGKNNITPINSYGYGIHTVDFGKEHMGYGHSGHIDGFSTVTSFFPDDKLTISLFDNGAVIGVNEIALSLLNILFDKPFTFPNFQEVAVSDGELQGLGGIYTAPDYPLELHIMPHGNELWAQATGQDSFRLVALGQDKFEFKAANITTTFERDANGKALQLQMEQGGEKGILKRKNVDDSNNSELKIADEILTSYEGVYSAADFPIKITIRKEKGGITAQATGQSSFPLQAINNREFKFEPAQIEIRFNKNSDGKIAGMTLKQQDTREFIKE